MVGLTQVLARLVTKESAKLLTLLIHSCSRASLKMSLASLGADKFINLAGAAIGNGWTSPIHQYSASTKGWANGMISIDQKNKIDSAEKTCANLLNAGSYDNHVCFALMDDIIDGSASQKGGKSSIYDDRIFGKDVHDPFPPGHATVEVSERSERAL